MFSEVCGAIAPVMITLLLGYGAAWRKLFTRDHATAINRMVLKFALPLSLFESISRIPRHEIAEAGPMALIIVLGMAGGYLVTLLVSRFVFHRSLTLATLQALAIGNPSVPFVGSAVLGFLYGARSALPISLASVTINLLVVPLSLFMLASAGHSSSSIEDDRRSEFEWLKYLTNSLKQPVVWAPALSLSLVLCGFHLPSLANGSFRLLGSTTGGAAMFSSGILLFFERPVLNLPVVTSVILRNVAVPLFGWFLALQLGVSAQWLSESVVTLSMPAAAIIVILSSQVGIGEREASSVLFFSTLGSIVTMAFFIAMTASPS